MPSSTKGTRSAYGDLAQAGTVRVMTVECDVDNVRLLGNRPR